MVEAQGAAKCPTVQDSPRAGDYFGLRLSHPGPEGELSEGGWEEVGAAAATIQGFAAGAAGRSVRPKRGPCSDQGSEGHLWSSVDWPLGMPAWNVEKAGCALAPRVRRASLRR